MEAVPVERVLPVPVGRGIVGMVGPFAVPLTVPVPLPATVPIGAVFTDAEGATMVSSPPGFFAFFFAVEVVSSLVVCRFVEVTGGGSFGGSAWVVKKTIAPTRSKPTAPSARNSPIFDLGMAAVPSVDCAKASDVALVCAPIVDALNGGCGIATTCGCEPWPGCEP